MAECYFCHNEVDPEHPDTWKQVLGWVGGPRKDSMKLRANTGGYAHDTCVGKVQSGQAADQASMFEETASSSEQNESDMKQAGELFDDRD